jgi:hypothetical protein
MGERAWRSLKYTSLPNRLKSKCTKTHSIQLGVKWLNMAIVELEDFWFQAEAALIIDDLDIDEYRFTPYLVFLLDWAVSRGYLSEELINDHAFIKKHQNLHDGSMSFKNFVDDCLDCRLVKSFFIDEIASFLSDYHEYEGYVSDLKNTFKVMSMWLLPESFDKSEYLYQLIDQSRINYIENLKKFPNLRIFYSPEKLKAERHEIEDQDLITLNGIVGYLDDEGSFTKKS